MTEVCAVDQGRIRVNVGGAPYVEFTDEYDSASMKSTLDALSVLHGLRLPTDEELVTGSVELESITDDGRVRLALLPAA